MTRDDDGAGLRISDIAARAGIGEGTLRMWEARYGFPSPRRLPSGHRRYAEDDVAGVVAVLRARAEGLALPVAIERARRLGADPRPSVYGALRDLFPHLSPQVLPKPALLWLSRAIEDECCARAPRPLLFACFQHERFYRHVEARWRELARTSERAVVLADFSKLRKPRRAPAEVPIRSDDPIMREWVVVCDAPELPACLVGWERPPVPGHRRTFETLWTVEPQVVRQAARACCDLASRTAPAIVADLRDRLADTPAPAGERQLRAAVEVTSRLAAYAAAAV